MAKERGILFSAPMVRALLDDRKTQTRRPVKVQPPAEAVSAGVISSSTDSNGLWWWLDGNDLDCSVVGDEFRCPYGVPGDRLWVRETCRAVELENGADGVYYPADGAFRPIENTAEAAERWGKLFSYRKGRGLNVNSIHMPRWASRITLEIAEIRVERLNDISRSDAAAEGLIKLPATGRYVIAQGDQYFGGAAFDPRGVFSSLWERINGDGSWAANPWVWVVVFRRDTQEAMAA